MNKHKYIAGFVALAGLAFSLQAFAINPCTPNIPARSSGSLRNAHCGPSGGPRATGNAHWDKDGIKLSYDINLDSTGTFKHGSAAGLPVGADGQTQVKKSGGGFCPGVTDQDADNNKVSTFPCRTAFTYAAAKYRITVGGF